MTTRWRRCSSPRGRLAASALGRNLALGALLAILLFLTAYPMGMLVYGSLHSTPPGEAGTFSLDGYRAIARVGITASRGSSAGGGSTW